MHNRVTVPTECMSWFAEERMFAACISDTPLHGKGTPFRFLMKSGRTGRTIDVVLACEHRDGTVDNELTHWTYKPTDPMYDFKVTLYND